MKKKIMLVGFLAVLLLTLPFTAIANGPNDRYNKNDERPKEEPEISSVSSAFGVHNEYFPDELTADNQYSIELLQTLLDEMEPVYGNDPVFQDIQAQIIALTEESSNPLSFCDLLFLIVFIACGDPGPLCYILGPIYWELCVGVTSTTSTSSAECGCQTLQLQQSQQQQIGTTTATSLPTTAVIITNNLGR